MAKCLLARAFSKTRLRFRDLFLVDEPGADVSGLRLRQDALDHHLGGV